jgi:hypothetical protein
MKSMSKVSSGSAATYQDHLWLLDPAPRTLEVYRLDGGGWRVVLTAAGNDRVRAEPFDAIELELASAWGR